MVRAFLKFGLLSLLAVSIIVASCIKEDPVPMEPDDDDLPVDTTDNEVVEVNILNLLTNQVNELIIPTCENYQVKMNDLLSEVEGFVDNTDGTGLASVKSAYLEAYLAYQSGAVHDYYATANVNLVNTTNLYPVDVNLLNELIENGSYNFNTTAQQRANGFPALDYMLYGVDDVVSTFSNDSKRVQFLLELVNAMKDKADSLLDRWTGNLKENFINNGGVELGSSVSVQLNNILIYYEDHIRGNKVGLPIGLSGPNDTPIDPDPTKIEAYYQALQEGNNNISLTLLRAAIEEMEDIYLGTTSSGEDGISYEDLLLDKGQESLDTDIKAQFQAIYDQINSRSSISGDENLYNSIQALVTLYKSDLFPVLNVQDADGSNDGD